MFNRRKLFKLLLGIPIVSRFVKKPSLEEIDKCYTECMTPNLDEMTTISLRYYMKNRTWVDPALYKN